MVSDIMKTFLSGQQYTEPINEAYSMDNGGFVISMENAEVLGEIYELEYQLECEHAKAIAISKQMGVPIEESISGTLTNMKNKIVEAWYRVKEWIEKLRKKLADWYANIIRGIEGLLGNPAKYVEKYRGYITKANVEEFRNDIETYKYTNMYTFMKQLGNTYIDAANELKRVIDMKTTRNALNNADLAKEGDKLSFRASNLFIDNITRTYLNSLGLNATNVDDVIDDLSGYAFGYFRNGAKPGEKKVPDKIDILDEVDYVLGSKKQTNDIKECQKKIDKVLHDYQKYVDDWSKKFSSLEVGGETVASSLTRSISVLQDMTNRFTNAYVKALKERASTAFVICKKAASQSIKAGNGNSTYRHYLVGTPDERNHAKDLISNM